MQFKKHSYNIILIAGLVALTGLTMFGQDVRRDRNLRKAAGTEVVPDSTRPVVRNFVSQPIDSVSPIQDSLARRRDSLRVADSTFRADSIALLDKSSLSRPAFSGAKDSIRQDFSNGQRKMYYWGDVEVSYDNIKLKADYMEYDMSTGTVFARGTYDSLSKEWKGQPEMTQGGQTFNMEEVRYNFNTRKARITNMITKEDDGILHGKNIKMMPDKSINITKGKYTVCDLEHPHYYLKLSSAKVVTKDCVRTGTHRGGGRRPSDRYTFRFHSQASGQGHRSSYAVFRGGERPWFLLEGRRNVLCAG